jgi:hypothetical protein
MTELATFLRSECGECERSCMREANMHVCIDFHLPWPQFRFILQMARIMRVPALPRPPQFFCVAVTK